MNITSESIKEITKALSIAQSKMTNVTKDKDGLFGHKYAELSSYLEMIRIPLMESELAFTQVITMLESGQTVLISMLLHSSGEWLKSIIPLNVQGSKQMNDTQALGSAITYLRRYTLCAMLGLAQEDDDGHKAGIKNEDKNCSNQIPAAGKPKVSMDIPAAYDYSRMLRDKCVENGIDSKLFANFHNISSSNLESVKNALDNFEALLTKFNEKEKYK